ncbi:MAG: spore protease YyaC [Negativicutes bacterium]|nr:spore protease YyaC [Negativicutes bacterium]
MSLKNANKIIANLSKAGVAEKIADHLWLLLSRQEGIKIRPVVILCIGSDRYTGDALGPLIGSYLLENGPYTVYGSLERPVHAGNLVETIRMIEAHYIHPVIIAIDACLGKPSEIGNIEVWEGGVEAGIAVGNRLPCVGDVSIIGVVNSGGQFSYIDLQTTPLSIVIKLSKIIGGALVQALVRLRAADAAAGLSRP